MKLSQFLCKLSIVCLLSSSANANVSMANMPSNEVSIYVQLMSLKSTTLDELADDFETLNQKGYKICTKRTERWHQIFVGLLAIIANLEIEIAYYLNTLNSLKIKPYRSVRLGDAEFGNGHDHKINQPSIVVKMWKRTG